MLGPIPQVSNRRQRYSPAVTARTGLHQTGSGDVVFLL
jgi:hypothetical protein